MKLNGLFYNVYSLYVTPLSRATYRKALDSLSKTPPCGTSLRIKNSIEKIL